MTYFTTTLTLENCIFYVKCKECIVIIELFNVYKNHITAILSKLSRRVKRIITHCFIVFGVKVGF